MHEAAIEKLNASSNCPRKTHKKVESNGVINTEKIIDLIERRAREQLRFYSVEASPGADAFDLLSLPVSPLFAAVTWLGDVNVDAGSEAPSLQLAAELTSIPVLAYITCYRMTPERLDEILQRNKTQNVFALRGGNYIYDFILISKFNAVPLFRSRSYQSTHALFK